MRIASLSRLFPLSEYKIFTELESVAKVQSIKSSNAIEGIVTSDERIAAIVNQNSAPLNHNEAEIAGYKDALNEIHLGYEHIDFKQHDILRLHEIMLSIVGYEFGGQYKTDDKVILEVDGEGRQCNKETPTESGITAANCFVYRIKWNYVCRTRTIQVCLGSPYFNILFDIFYAKSAYVKIVIAFYTHLV